MRRQESSSEDRLTDAAYEPSAPKANPGLRLTIERLLGRLTAQQREVFLLFEVEGFRHLEIATMLEISEAASKNALFQAKKNLRVMLTEPRQGTPPSLGEPS